MESGKEVFVIYFQFYSRLSEKYSIFIRIIQSTFNSIVDYPFLHKRAERNRIHSFNSIVDYLTT